MSRSIALSDHYIALIDATASLAEAATLGPRIIASLSGEGLIEPRLSTECVLGGQGFPAGPGCAQAYDVAKGEHQFWTLRTSGVELHSTPWVNAFGFTAFEMAACPRCTRVQGEGFLDRVAEAASSFNADSTVPNIACEVCGVSTSLHEWTCAPHLGFVNLAIVFWNWPPFDAPGWRLDIPALLRRALGRPFIATHGHV